ncbi:MAG: hypothetical protein ACRDN8_05895 [Thermoleophilaceae bacterium]
MLLNAWIDPSAVPARMATSPTLDGAHMLFCSQQAIRERLSESHSPSPHEWGELVPHGLLLATFVGVHRSRQAHMFVRERLNGAKPFLDDYARRLWHPEDEQDLLALMPVLVEDHSFAREASTVAVNPTFALSSRLGGADADLVTDGTLWDYKATKQTRILRREDIWQLAAYLLADLDDRFAVRAVGISALRWRSRVRWQAADLFGQLGGEAADGVDLSQWRSRFEAMLPQSPRRSAKPGSTDRVGGFRPVQNEE